MVLLYLPPPQTFPRLSQGSVKSTKGEKNARNNKREARQGNNGTNIPQKVIASDGETVPYHETKPISIYTLSDLGDLSNLIGSLSRTIQQYSPPSEWIMCELSVFPIFLENDLLKVDKILGLTFFKARKYLEGFNTAFFNLL